MNKKLLQVERLSIALKNPYQELVKDIRLNSSRLTVLVPEIKSSA